MQKHIFTTLFITLIGSLAAFAQKWQPGYFYDVKGNKVTGLIRIYPSGKPPIKDEAFFEYKEFDKATAIKVTASDLNSFTVGRDSFVVAANGGWSRYELDFVKVVVNSPTRLYQAQGYGGESSSGVSVGADVGTGFGFGGGGSGFGTGVGAGISIPVFGSGRSGSRMSLYFYGTNTANMKPISNLEFIDIMTEVMADEPEVVEQIKLNKYNLGNMDKLIAYYKKLEAAAQKSGD